MSAYTQTLIVFGAIVLAAVLCIALGCIISGARADRLADYGDPDLDPILNPERWATEVQRRADWERHVNEAFDVIDDPLEVTYRLPSYTRDAA